MPHTPAYSVRETLQLAAEHPVYAGGGQEGLIRMLLLPQGQAGGQSAEGGGNRILRRLNTRLDKTKVQEGKK
jgi:hypothetical protein